MDASIFLLFVSISNAIWVSSASSNSASESSEILGFSAGSIFSIPSLYTPTLSFPSFFERYIAISARLKSSVYSSPLSGNILIPTEQLITKSPLPVLTVVLICLHTSSATLTASSAVAFFIRTRNSSPPIRPTISVLLKRAIRWVATVLITVSPYKCPNESLILLNSSTSIIIRACSPSG